MDIKDKEERIRLFLQLIDTFKADTWVDNIFDIIKEYDLPKHMDRDFEPFTMLILDTEV